MAKCIIATFGWTEQFVLSSILKHGIKAGDKIILLIPAKRDEKSEAILRDFEQFLSKYGEGIKLENKRVPLQSFEEAVVSISETLRNILSEGYDRLIINLSGGMRILILAAYVAAFLTCPRDIVIELETEDRERGYIVPNFSIKELIKLKDIERRILEKLDKGIKSTPELLRELNIPRSTLHKHLKELEKNGLLTLKKNGRALTLNITALGKLTLIGAKQ
ncbi:MAG: CRISPR-associated CARF protein Csa3 [archaeon YNP-WB-062]|jgi:CRISPR locus-related DNA-binding protein|nr:CRISPR-associated CARF protein Csa3 [Candidatus Culexarchaeum yellowstonense]